MRNFVWLLFALPAAAQFIPAGAPIPKTAKPPIVFLNGYETSCTNTAFADTFGKFDQFFQAANRATLLFDNCAYPGKPAIEELGNRFAAYLNALVYTDGSRVPQVDVVAHSMGGLIVRSYLAGMQTDGTFTPPEVPLIRKAVFLSTPHFGTDIAAVFGFDVQTQELSTASQFVFNLGTWNQGTDDLRGIDALALAGSGGAGTLNGSPTGDGVSTLTSSSIGFAFPMRTRVIPYCHISFAALTSLAGSFLAAQVCPPGSAGIAAGLSLMDTNVAAVTSFLNDTPDWQTIGLDSSANPVLSTQAGVILRAQSATGQYLTIQDAAAGRTNLKPINAAPILYNEFVPAGPQNFIVDVTGAKLTPTITLNAGYTNALTVKTGPQIARIFPAAAAVFPLGAAPGSFVSIYGTNLAPGITQASTTPLPTMLNGTQVLVNGTAVPLQIVTPNQINAVLPTYLSGSLGLAALLLGVPPPTIVTVTVVSPNGRHTVNLLLPRSAPALFTQNGAGTGIASILNAVTNVPVSPTAPLHAGDFAAIYLTGLGGTASPTVTIAGQSCPVQYAGNAPGFAGLDQINCQIPAGIPANPAAPVTVTANGRISNTATLPLQ